MFLCWRDRRSLFFPPLCSLEETPLAHMSSCFFCSSMPDCRRVFSLSPSRRVGAGCTSEPIIAQLPSSPRWLLIFSCAANLVRTRRLVPCCARFYSRRGSVPPPPRHSLIIALLAPPVSFPGCSMPPQRRPVEMIGSFQSPQVFFLHWRMSPIER